MTKTELTRDAGTIAGAALVLVGLYLFWPASAFIVAGIVVLRLTGAIELPNVPRRSAEQ